jgi:chromosome segregation ATPase
MGTSWGADDGHGDLAARIHGHDINDLHGVASDLHDHDDRYSDDNHDHDNQYANRMHHHNRDELWETIGQLREAVEAVEGRLAGWIDAAKTTAAEHQAELDELAAQLAARDIELEDTKNHVAELETALNMVPQSEFLEPGEDFTGIYQKQYRKGTGQ